MHKVSLIQVDLQIQEAERKLNVIGSDDALQSLRKAEAIMETARLLLLFKQDPFYNISD